MEHAGIEATAFVEMKDGDPAAAKFGCQAARELLVQTDDCDFIAVARGLGGKRSDYTFRAIRNKVGNYMENPNHEQASALAKQEVRLNLFVRDMAIGVCRLATCEARSPNNSQVGLRYSQVSESTPTVHTASRVNQNVRVIAGIRKADR
jgi:hypothetical protein